jgi:hypothetical protein
MHPMLGTIGSGFFLHLVIFLLWFPLTENVEAYDKGNDHSKKAKIEKLKHILNQQTVSPLTATTNRQWLNLFGSLQ